MESVEDHIAENLVYGKRNENDLTLTTQSPLLKTLKKKALENIVEKGENAQVTSIFSFSDSVFHSIKEKNHHSSNV